MCVREDDIFHFPSFPPPPPFPLISSRMADLAQQLEQVKTKAREVILKQKQELEAANAAMAEVKSELVKAQMRSLEIEKALDSEKLALQAANEALSLVRGHGGASLNELARIGKEREAERDGAMVVAETLTATQKQLVETKRELASAQFARQEAERARREDVEAVRVRLERDFGEEKARLTRELEAACAELNAARADAIKSSGETASRLRVCPNHPYFSCPTEGVVVVVGF